MRQVEEIEAECERLRQQLATEAAASEQYSLERDQLKEDRDAWKQDHERLRAVCAEHEREVSRLRSEIEIANMQARIMARAADTHKAEEKLWREAYRAMKTARDRAVNLASELMRPDECVDRVSAARVLLEIRKVDVAQSIEREVKP